MHEPAYTDAVIAEGKPYREILRFMLEDDEGKQFAERLTRAALGMAGEASRQEVLKKAQEEARNSGYVGKSLALLALAQAFVPN